MSARDETCTCRSGRDHDGSEFGLCGFCERQMDEDARQRSIARDAARWRISQLTRPSIGWGVCGFFVISGDDFVHAGIQPHPITNATGINHCIMGRGKTKVEAIDGLFASLTAYCSEGKYLADDIEAIRVLFEENRA